MARAVIVIDVQNEYFPGGRLPLHSAGETETGIVRALKKAREAGDAVILVRHESPASDGLFAAGSVGADIRPTVLQSAPDAPIVVKRFADAFQETDLTAHLEGVDKLLVCGMMTQNCVVFTALSAAASSYEVSILSDLCAAPTEIVHQIALNALRSKLSVREAGEVWPA